jgi:hypothetical protein
VALAGASVIAVTPVAPLPPDIRIANPATRLAAASHGGLIDAIAAVPAYEAQAIRNLNRIVSEEFLGDGGGGLFAGGILGVDADDEELVRAVVNVLVPFPALNGPFGGYMFAVAQHALPVDLEGCRTYSTCTDPLGYLGATALGLLTTPLFAAITLPRLIADLTTSLSTPSATLSSAPTMDVANPTLKLGATTFTLTTDPPVHPPAQSPSAATGLDKTQDVASEIATAGGLTGAGTATEAPSNAAGVHDPVLKTVAPESGHGLETASAPVDKPEPTITTSTNVTRDGNKVEPGQVGVNGTTSRGGLDGAVRSVSDQISSAISTVTNGLTGGGAKTAESAESGNDETGN